MDWSDRIGRRIKLRDLHILMAIADTGSMAKAAARLRISHPAISKTISDIEGTLGVRLLDRGSQGAELTRLWRSSASMWHKYIRRNAARSSLAGISV